MDTIPKVAPIQADAKRPLWSVMIPTFNCANYLRQTLASVLAQAPGPEDMQIEVVDDCSTKDDPEAVVREAGQGRVLFHRKQVNEGATANFNTCIQRSRGHLVHILHGDDWVLPGFYHRVQATAELHPDAGLIATRCFFVDELSVITGVSDRVPTLETVSSNTSEFRYKTPVQCAGVVVRRESYEQLGGFMGGLAHTADNEMWSRVVQYCGGIVLADVLCCYRIFAMNDSGRLARTAANIQDIIELNKILAARLPDFSDAAARSRASDLAWHQARLFKNRGDTEAFRANLAVWWDLAPPWRKIKTGLRVLSQLGRF